MPIIENENGQNVLGRQIMSRKLKDHIGIDMVLAPGEDVPGCCACFQAPSCCALCGVFPCCEDPEYIIVKREASKYIFVRENSIEWNEPITILKTGSCLGLDPCEYDIQDRVHTVYFDDPMFDSITDKTRCCNETRTCIGGGKGERIQLSSTCCCGCCYRSAFPCPFVPICCPISVFPCAARYDIYTADAQKSLYEIKRLRAIATSQALYSDSFGSGGASDMLTRPMERT